MNSNKTVLITGASSGIGYELTWLFARDGYNLVLVARSEQQLQHMANELQEVHGVSVKVIVKDLALACAPGEIFAELQRENIQVDILANNAGFHVHEQRHYVSLPPVLNNTSSMEVKP
ncbi:MAG TPA: hypothetical protein DEV72_16085 [Ktedonobacter sp.]|nr:hypothetical protein [Ktedonobacter sp.]